MDQKARGSGERIRRMCWLLYGGLHRVELVGETLRAALNELASSEPEWVVSWVPEEWFVRYGRRIEEWRLPGEKSHKSTSCSRLGKMANVCSRKSAVKLPQTDAQPPARQGA